MSAKPSKSSRSNTGPLLVALVGVVLFVLLVVAWVLPPLQDRGALAEDAEAAQRAARNAEEDLRKLTSGDSTAAELAARASAGDSYFRYFPSSVEDPVNEANLVFPELFAAAARDAGLAARTSPDDDRCDLVLGFPASGSDLDAPGGLGAVELDVSLLGGPGKPQEYLNALRRQQVLATVASAVVSDPGSDNLCSGSTTQGSTRSEGDTASKLPRGQGDLTSAALQRHDLRLVVWYTTEPPVELDPTSAGG